jgi:hypothetical protein
MSKSENANSAPVLQDDELDALRGRVTFYKALDTGMFKHEW